MPYINTETNTIHSEADIRAAFPNTSFPSPFVPPEEYAVVFPSPAPAYNPITQAVRETTPILTNKGHYEQAWEVVELYATQEERDAAIAADAEAKRIAAVPKSVSPRQIRQAMTRFGIRQAVETAIAAGDQDIKDWYEFATEFERKHPMVDALATGLGVSERQLDDLFTLAGTL